MVPSTSKKNKITMTKQDIEHFDNQFQEIKDTYEEVKRSYRIFNDDFLEAVQKVIEDKLDAHKNSDKEIITEFISNNNKRMVKIEKRIFDIEHKLIDLK